MATSATKAFRRYTIAVDGSRKPTRFDVDAYPRSLSRTLDDGIRSNAPLAFAHVFSLFYLRFAQDRYRPTPI